jgi:hypothetical protein
MIDMITLEQTVEESNNLSTYHTKDLLTILGMVICIRTNIHNELDRRHKK